jgi:hypothetical protein
MSSSHWVNITIAAMGLVATIISGAIGYASGGSVIKKEYVQIAISNLNNKESSPNMRSWSMEVISEFSPIPFGKDLRSNIVSGKALFPPPQLPASLSQNCDPVPVPPSPMTDPERIVWEHNLISAYGDCAARHRLTVDAWPKG